MARMRSGIGGCVAMQAKERFAQAVAKKHVAQVGRVLGFQARTVTILADFLERAGKSAGIARELHG